VTSGVTKSVKPLSKCIKQVWKSLPVKDSRRNGGGGGNRTPTIKASQYRLLYTWHKFFWILSAYFVCPRYQLNDMVWAWIYFNL